MATAEAASRLSDRHSRKRPFAGWMKRLANLKSSSSESPSGPGKKTGNASHAKVKKSSVKNNPYPESSQPGADTPARLSFTTPVTPCSNQSYTSVEEVTPGQQQVPNRSNRSTAPTVATVPETVRSGRSKAETGISNFANGDSTFSSPNTSEHSLTTTLTTIQSTAPSNVLNSGQNNAILNAPPVHFSHQFPTSPPPSAIPSHLVSHQQPSSYQSATANNMLTDDASILTLASSSKRRRRNSLDTNASMRALAPSSYYGGSRESLPLSVLSANPDNLYHHPVRPSNVGGFANAERASVYSASGATAPVLSSERNSYCANKQNVDALSIRSGPLGHGRTNSTSSIRITANSPLASPREHVGSGRLSRRSTDWKDARDMSDEEEAPAELGAEGSCR